MNFTFLLFVASFQIISIHGFCQSPKWKVQEGHAVVEKSLVLPGKSSNDIYKEIYRWLMKRYEDPEDILKARLEDEYFRGRGYHSNLLTGAEVSAGLGYSFSFEIKQEEVTFKIFDAVVLFSNTQDDDREYPIEDYLVEGIKKKHREPSGKILSAAQEFSDAMFKAVEEALTPKYK